MTSVIGFVALIITALWLGSCETLTVLPLYQDKNLTWNQVDNIAVLPTVDARLDKKTKLELLDKWVHSRLEDCLLDKGYSFKILTDRSLVQDFAEDSFSEIDSASITALKPQDKRWILIPVLHDFSSKITFGSTANSEISAYLFDKKAGKLVWRHKATGQAGQGGLFGMAEILFVRKKAVTNAVSTLILALPSRQGKR